MTDARKKLLNIYLGSIGTVFHISLYAQKDRSSEKNWYGDLNKWSNGRRDA